MIRPILIVIITVGLFVSCDLGVVFDSNQELKGASWSSDEHCVFEFETQDTISAFNMYFNLRNLKTYPYSNLYVFYHTYLPNGQYDLDTLQFIIAEPNGKWIGDVSGSIVSNQILFRRKFRFPQAGKYRFEIEQAMRNQELTGISDVGLRIEKFQ